MNQKTASALEVRAHKRSKLEYKQLPPDSTGKAKIYRITTLNSDASGSYSVSIVTKPGNTYFTANIDSVVTVA